MIKFDVALIPFSLRVPAQTICPAKIHMEYGELAITIVNTYSGGNVLTHMIPASEIVNIKAALFDRGENRTAYGYTHDGETTEFVIAENAGSDEEVLIVNTTRFINSDTVRATTLDVQTFEAAVKKIVHNYYTWSTL